MYTISFETFLRKLKYIKNLEARLTNFNGDLTKLICDPSDNSGVYVYLFDEIYCAQIEQLVKDINDSLGLTDCDETICVSETISYLIYDGEYGTSGSFSIPNSEKMYDNTVWNAYCDIYGVLNECIADSFSDCRFTI